MAGSPDEIVLADLLDAAVEYISVKESLLAYHRAGSPPSEAFWRRQAKAQQRWTWARLQANVTLGRVVDSARDEAP